MSEYSPEFEPTLDQAVSANDQEFGAANDAVYDIPSAEVVDIATGEAYPAAGESIIEELTPSVPPLAVEQDQLIASSYDVAMRRFGLDPYVAQIDPTPEVSSLSPVELDNQGEAMQALIEGIPSVLPQAAAEAQPLTSATLDPTVAEEKTIAQAPEIQPAISAEVLPKSKEVPEDILSSYKERFGINKEDLEGVEGFKDLSRGQQRQVLENLAQITIGKIRTEAVDGQTEEFNTKQKDAKLLGKIWNGLKNSVIKKAEVINREKKLASEIQNGGIAEHKDALEQMTRGMKELGPAIKEGENGELEVQFVETDGMSPEVAKVAEVFNIEGSKLSKIPYEWSLESASAEQKKSYAEAKETYELQRSVLLEQMKKEGGDEKAIKAMAHTESVVEMQRFIQTCPDAVEGLKNIENQSAITAALKSVGTERGLYMAGGALLRTSFGLVAGFAAAPAAAAIMGGIRGWKKTGDQLVLQDAAQRRGEAPVETEKVKQSKARIGEINVALANLDDERVKTELKAELDSLNKSVRGTTQNMVEAFSAEDIAGDKEAESGDRRRGATAKLEYLKAEIASLDEQLMSGPAADEAGNLEEKKAKLTAQLERRVNYTKMKVSDGKMVFGAEGERLGNQYALMRSMAEAEAVLGAGEVPDSNGDKAERRLAKMLNATDVEIKDARFKKKLGQAVKAGIIGGALAGLGAAAADAAKWMNGATGTLAEKAFGDAADVKAEIAGAVDAAKEEVVSLGNKINAVVAAEYVPYVDGSQALLDHAPIPNNINGLDLPPDYKFPSSEVPIEESLAPGESLEAALPHHVTQGENLSTIFAHEIPTATNADVIRLLRSMSAAQLHEIGVSSGNPDLIYPGDNINVGRMREMLSASPSGVASTEGYVDGSQGLPHPSVTPGRVSVEAVLPETTGGAFGTPAEINNMTEGQSINGGMGTSPTGTAGIAASSGAPGGAVDPRAPHMEPHVETAPVLPPPPRSEVVFEQTNPEQGGHYAIRPAAGKGIEHGSVLAGGEVAPVPVKSLSEMTPNDWQNWPANKPEPWAVTDAEAEKWFDTKETLAMAKMMKKALGRYPTDTEYDQFDHLLKTDQETAARLMKAMQTKPLSQNDILAIKGTKSLVEPTSYEVAHQVVPKQPIQPSPVQTPSAGTPIPSSIPTQPKAITGLDVNNAIRTVTANSTGTVKTIADAIGQQAASGVSFTKGAGAVIAQNASNPALKVVGQFIGKIG